MSSAISKVNNTSLLRCITLTAGDIKLAHSVFALPFALLAMFLAAGSADRFPGAVEIILIILCMVFARTVAMTINRWADSALDAQNPRTAGRAIPSGKLPRGFMLAAAGACAAGFILSAAGFYWLNGNFWPVVLSPLVLIWLAGYSFTKRFTFFCHIILGAALAISPVATVIAIQPQYLTHPAPWLLFINLICWVGGFDVIYALQDVAVDRKQGLFSMPATLGQDTALWISRLLHLISALCLFLLVFLSSQLGILFFIAVCITITLLILEHALVWGNQVHRMKIAFGTLNGIISLLLGAAGITDIIWGLLS